MARFRGSRLRVARLQGFLPPSPRSRRHRLARSHPQRSRRSPASASRLRSFGLPPLRRTDIGCPRPAGTDHAARPDRPLVRGPITARKGAESREHRESRWSDAAAGRCRNPVAGIRKLAAGIRSGRGRLRGQLRRRMRGRMRGRMPSRPAAASNPAPGRPLKQPPRARRTTPAPQPPHAPTPRDTAKITSPANDPTTVPLIRMNCRSRPMWASILRVVCSASQPATVSVIRDVISLR